MREIKFRGKTLGGEWVTGLLAKQNNNYFISNSMGKPFAFDIRPETIGQFTGLHDKNGKENYESDLIKDERTNIIFEIVWNDDFAGWWCVSLDKTIEQPLCNINKYCINIGNTHENTEFIK